MAAPPPDSDKPTSNRVPPPELAMSPPPGPPGDPALVATPIDGPQPQGTPIKPPQSINWAPVVSPMDSPQPTSAQSPPVESKKSMEDGNPVAVESLTDHPQPPGTPQTPQGQFSSWSSGLYDCRSDMDTCCLVFWCPCIAFGRMAEILDEGKSSCCCKGTLYSLLHVLSIAAIVLGAPVTLHFILTYKYRGKLKRRLDFPPSCREDFCTHFWCEACALCQEYRQLQTHGYHLSLGWHGNLDKQRQARLMASTTMASPPISPTMKR